jgi:AcrR family transcriptional regulator
MVTYVSFIFAQEHVDELEAFVSPRSTVHAARSVPQPRGGPKGGRKQNLGTSETERRADGPPSARGRRARAEFEHAARELFATEGYFRTTVEDIAKAAGRTKAAFYRYFANREQLLISLSDEFTHEVPARAGAAAIRPQSADDWPFFLSAAQAYRDSYVANRGVMVAVFQLATVDERFAARQTEIRKFGQDIIEDTVRQAQRHGYCQELDPAIAAGALAAMIEHFCFVSLGQVVGHLAVDETKAVETIATLWHRTLYGVLPAADG